MRDIQYRDEGRPEDLLQELGYETQDIAYRKFATYIAYFFGFFLFCIVCGFGVMKWMTKTGLSGGRMADSVPKVDMPVGTPLLQSNITARTDIRSLRMKETAQMDTPAVIDQAHGVYRIPVDQAIDDVANGTATDRASIGLPPETASNTSGQKLSDLMTEPDFSASNMKSGGANTSQGSAIQKLVQTNPTARPDVFKVSTPNPIKVKGNSAKAPSNASRGASATSKPKGGKGG